MVNQQTEAGKGVMMEHDLIKKTQVASEQWKQFFNRGDAAGCASMYQEDATMEAKPFGTFVGRPEIQAFWQNLIDQGFAEVSYIDPEVELLSSGETLLKSGWKMNNARGVITKELWKLQSDGSMRLSEDHFEALG